MNQPRPALLLAPVLAFLGFFFLPCPQARAEAFSNPIPHLYQDRAEIAHLSPPKALHPAPHLNKWSPGASAIPKIAVVSSIAISSTYRSCLPFAFIAKEFGIRTGLSPPLFA